MDIILERLAALMPMSSKDETRHHLCGINIKPTDTTWTLSVTDGFVGCIEEVPSLGLPTLKEEIMIFRDQLPALKKASKEVLLSIKIDHDLGVLVINKEHFISFKTSLSIGKYPNIKNLHPKTPGDKMISFNPELLMTIQKALKSTKVQPVKLYFKDCSTPITVKCGEREAILMPCRV
jgi:DNA polymerase III sliding clamp (beta) subunit (PCNA family)